MDLKVIPFGNARIENKTVSCQHGAGECDANSYEQCVIHFYPDPQHYLPMLACLYKELPMHLHPTNFSVDPFEKCALGSNLEFSSIKHCHDCPNLSWKVLREAAEATPDYHDHVPWVEINGIYMDEESSDFATEVCRAYEASGGSNPVCNAQHEVLEK